MNLTPIQTNKAIIVTVTTTLCALAAACVAAVCYISFTGGKVPPELNTLTATLVGAIAAMLTKTAPSEQTPAVEAGVKKVEVVNKPDKPVQTEEVNEH